MKRETISTVERVLLFCYNYDPQSGGYVLYAVKLMRVAGGLTVILILAGWGFLLRKQKIEKK
ncbi:MAG: protein SCO1/2 [Candidatus Marinamargulisbacteria bacterium]